MQTQPTPDKTVQAVRNNLGAVNQERTYVDKILSKEEIKEMSGELLSKKIFLRADVNKLQYLLNGSELKLTNLGEQQRYVHNKYYCWIEETMAVYCLYLDYKEDITSNGKEVLDAEGLKLYDDLLALGTGCIKQLTYLYFHLNRSSLSISGWGIDNLLKNKQEYLYDQNITSRSVEPDRKKFFGVF